MNDKLIAIRDALEDCRSTMLICAKDGNSNVEKENILALQAITHINTLIAESNSSTCVQSYCTLNTSPKYTEVELENYVYSKYPLDDEISVEQTIRALIEMGVITVKKEK